jgi:bifunctional non-homologous end joining protein LigD
MASGTGRLEVAGVEITNPERIVYPKSGISKRDLVRYWSAVAELALPLLAARPLTLFRCPKGIDGDCFFQRHAGDGMPDLLPRFRLRERAATEADPYMYVDGLPALISLVQLGALEFHVWTARVDRLDRPDMFVMDLDPAPDVPWSDVVRGAVALRGLLDELGLACWPRATGGKGLHVVAPLMRRSTWDEVGSFARALSALMAAAVPQLFVATAAAHRRSGRIYVDPLRNVRDAVAIASFSTRAREGAPVAIPLGWAELEESRGPPILSVREAADVDWKARDPWKGYAETRQSITRQAREALGIR